jgi:phosphoribosylaminoimidazolecarboxamide formyltransferase/IMP cyclohydrolase
LIKRALISVSDKKELGDLLGTLAKFKFKLISSGGTARAIRGLGYDVTEISDYTGYPESPGGLVKTLHPKIHGGLLLDPDNPEHKRYMDEQGIEPIGLLVVNLYPFEKVVERQGVEFLEAVENIDIGGPAMIRAAAKGALLHGRPVVVTDPSQYRLVVDELNQRDGSLSPDTVKGLAIEAFERTAKYDNVIKDYLRKVTE